MSWLYFIPPYTYHDIAADKDGYVRYGDNVVFIFLISQYKICIHLNPIAEAILRNIRNGLFYLEQKNILQ